MKIYFTTMRHVVTPLFEGLELSRFKKNKSRGWLIELPRQLKIYVGGGGEELHHALLS